jgi:hypothetical protein
VYGPAGSNFSAVKPIARYFGRALRREIGIVVDVGLIARARVDVGVGPQTLMHLPAEQLVDRLAGRLADDVPARHFQRAEDAHHAKGPECWVNPLE